MKILLIADIHGNHEALRAVLASAPVYDRLLCLGDITGYYTQVNEVIETLVEKKAVSIRGNHDQMVLAGGYSGPSEAVRFGIDAAQRILSSGHREWLETLPLSLGLELGGRSLLLVHGSPWKPLDEYLYADSARIPQLGDFQYEVIICGHTHKEFLIQTKPDQWVINPGSVGQSRTTRGVARAALFCTVTMKAEWLDFPYDPKPLIEHCRQRGAGDWVDKSLGYETL